LAYFVYCRKSIHKDKSGNDKKIRNKRLMNKQLKSDNLVTSRRELENMRTVISDGDRYAKVCGNPKNPLDVVGVFHNKIMDLVVEQLSKQSGPLGSCPHGVSIESCCIRCYYGWVDQVTKGQVPSLDQKSLSVLLPKVSSIDGIALLKIVKDELNDPNLGETIELINKLSSDLDGSPRSKSAFVKSILLHEEKVLSNLKSSNIHLTVLSVARYSASMDYNSLPLLSMSPTSLMGKSHVSQFCGGKKEINNMRETPMLFFRINWRRVLGSDLLGAAAGAAGGLAGAGLGAAIGSALELGGQLMGKVKGP
jgi:hypothetical protein